MEYLFFGAFSAIAAVIWIFIYPKVTAMSWASATTAKGYFGLVAVTAVVFFVVLMAASLLMSIVKRVPVLPAV